MSLSKPVRRKHMHTREIQCMGYQREDGLWDIEGRMTDRKTYSFDNIDRGGVSAGEAAHEMLIRLTLNNDMVVMAAEAQTVSAPYHICCEATDSFESLIGLKVGSGWRRAVVEAMGGIKGCTHLRDLLMGPLAVTAFQTIYTLKQNKEKDSLGKKPALLDSCHAYRSGSHVAKKRWPELFQDDGKDTSSTGSEN